MSESPDFEQIALSLAKKTSYYDDAEEVPGFTAGVLVAIEEQLRQVWNARGATDAKAVLSHPLTPGTGINQAELARNAELVKAITEHDR